MCLRDYVSKISGSFSEHFNTHTFLWKRLCIVNNNPILYLTTVDPSPILASSAIESITVLVDALMIP
jgi:hypothetical protein